MKQLKTNFSLILIACAAVFFFYSLSSGYKPEKRERGKRLLGTVYRAKEQKSFVLIIPSYNNEKYCVKNLTSVFEQDYQNYRVIYIDDASTDKTYKRVKKVVEVFEMEDKVTLIHNVTNQKAMANTYRAVHMCQDDEIVVILDGDDWLAHDNVLNYLNIAYENPNVWLTYGSSIVYPSYKRGHDQKPIPESVHEKHNYREQANKDFSLSHLRTAYAGLFKQVKLSDVLHKGNFFEASADEAFMVPLIEMAGKHSHFIRDTMYIYNRDTPISDDKVRFELLQECKNAIVSNPEYDLRVHWKRIPPDPKVDLVIHSKDSPMELYALLESIHKNVYGARRISIYYEAGSGEYEAAYQEIASEFSTDRFMPLERNWEELLKSLSKSGESNYLFALKGSSAFQSPIDLKDCVEALFSTRAECFVFSTPPSGISLYRGIMASVRTGAVDFQSPTLFPTQELANGRILLKGITLEFEEEKSTLLDLSEKRDELLTKFSSGLKIDLTQDEIAYISR